MKSPLEGEDLQQNVKQSVARIEHRRRLATAGLTQLEAGPPFATLGFALISLAGRTVPDGRKLDLVLTPDMAATVREAERRGEGASASEVVREALCLWRVYQAYRAGEIDAPGVAVRQAPRPSSGRGRAVREKAAAGRRGKAAVVVVEPCGSCEARHSSVCGALSEGQLERLASITTVLHFAPREPIVRAGDEALHVFNVSGGTAQVHRLLADGRRQITRFLFKGDFVGLAVERSYSYGVEAITPVVACRFPRRKFQAVLDSFPMMERRLLAMAAGEIAAAQDQMVLLGRKTAREKIASFLLALARRSGSVTVGLPMSRGEIADYLGLTTETVSRVLSQFQDQAIIRLQGRCEVLLLDRPTLETIAAG